MGGLVEMTWAGIRTDTETDFVTLKKKAGLDDVWVVNTFNVPERDTGFKKGCTKGRRGQAKNVADCSIIISGESFAVRSSRPPHFFINHLVSLSTPPLLGPYTSFSVLLSLSCREGWV